jgi:hypothetical protein
MKKIFIALSMALLLLCSSCSNTDYLNAVPAESSMLIAMDPAGLSGVGNQTLLKTMLHVSNLNKSGIDFSSKVLFFEDAQGNLGFCAKVDDDDQLADLLEKNGMPTQKKRGCRFALLPNNWMLGFSDESALLMGPIVPAAQAEMSSLMAKYLTADEDDGIVSTPMYEKLDSIDSPMAMVSQAKALPKQFVAPFTLGAPKTADPSEVIVAASMATKDGILWMDGQTFSFKQKVNNALHDAAQSYRPIKGDYVRSMADTCSMGIFMNVDGTKFIKLMQQDPSLEAMLAGINAAIDLDNIIKGIDGDMAIITPSLAESHFQLTMAAKVKNVDWLGDVDYWKQSVPQGGYIGDWGRDCYYYTSDKTTYYFGVTQDMQYMSGGSKEAALQSVKPSAHPLPQNVQKAIVGKKMAMVINMGAFGGDKAQAITSMLKPLFGNVSSIVYTMK